MFAHYFATKATKYILVTATNRPVNAQAQVPVTGKVHARKVAKQMGVKAWNF